jgi:hypothetical protein
MVEHLPSKCEALSLIPNTGKNKQTKEIRENDLL